MRVLRAWAVLWFGIALQSILFASTTNAQPAELFLAQTHYVMGTNLEIKLCRDNATATILEKAFAVARELDVLLSNYKEGSEISRLNKAGSFISLDARTFAFLQGAVHLSKGTSGAFDVTVGPLFDIWSQAIETKRVPSAAEILAARDRVGSHYITLKAGDRSAQFSRPGVSIDTRGVGKGFAVDQIMKFIRTAGVSCALVNFGHSSIAAVGSPPGGTAWKLLVQFPGQKPIGLLSLRDQSFSASSTVGQVFEIGGKKYGRIFDPRTGSPVAGRRESMVVAPSATTAEALSKALIVLSGVAQIDSLQVGDFQYLLIEGGDRIRARSPRMPLEITRVVREAAQ